MHRMRLVVLQELCPARGVGRMANRYRCKDRNPYRIRYMVALPEPPVLPANHQRYDRSDDRTGYRADQSRNKHRFERRRPDGRDRRLEQSRDHMPDWAVLSTDLGDIALGDGVGFRLGIVDGLACRCYRDEVWSQALDLHFASQLVDRHMRADPDRGS